LEFVVLKLQSIVLKSLSIVLKLRTAVLNLLQAVSKLENTLARLLQAVPKFQHAVFELLNVVLMLQNTLPRLRNAFCAAPPHPNTRRWPIGNGSRPRVEFHNETGYAFKPINVEKAILYTLMPVGSILRVPDSLWQTYLYASMLAGSALRGCHVLVVAPALETAPSSAPPTMARAHGVLSALVYF
jgi:hypothetical protein